MMPLNSYQSELKFFSKIWNRIHSLPSFGISDRYYITIIAILASLKCQLLPKAIIIKYLSSGQKCLSSSRAL